MWAGVIVSNPCQGRRPPHTRVEETVFLTTERSEDEEIDLPPPAVEVIDLRTSGLLFTNGAGNPGPCAGVLQRWVEAWSRWCDEGRASLGASGFVPHGSAPALGGCGVLGAGGVLPTGIGVGPVGRLTVKIDRWVSQSSPDVGRPTNRDQCLHIRKFRRLRSSDEPVG